MYKKSIIILLLTALLTGCKDKKEEDCVVPTIEKNLVGTWQTTFTSESDNLVVRNLPKGDCVLKIVGSL